MHPNQENQETSYLNILKAPSDSSSSSSAVTIVPSKPLEFPLASSFNKALTATELSLGATPGSVKADDSCKDVPDNEQTRIISNLKTSPGATASSSVLSVNAAANPCIKIISTIKPAPLILLTEPSTGKFHLKPPPTTLDEPVIFAILEYQRQNRYFPIPTYTPASHRTNIFDPFTSKTSDPLSPKKTIFSQDGKQPLTFTNCNECQGKVEGVYTGCHHPEDDGEYNTTVNFDRLGEHIQPRRIDLISQQIPKTIDSIDYEMLNCRNLTALLSENTDEHASHFVFVLLKSTYVDI